MTISRPDEARELAERLAAQERELERAPRARWRPGGRRSGRPAGAAATCDFTSVSGRAVEPVYTRARPAPAPSRGAGLAGRVSLPPRHPPDDVPRQAVDHAAVRRVRDRAGHQRSATSSCWRAGRPGSRSRSTFPTLMGYDSDHPRSEGEVGKCGVAISSLARHGGPVRRHPARPGLHLDDDQRPGGDPVLLLRRRRREAGRGPSAGSRAPSRTTC